MFAPSTRSARSRFAAIVLAVAGLTAAFAEPASATHFRYGHLTWRPRQDISPTTVEFTLVTAFRRNGYGGTAPDGFPAVGDQIDEHIGDTSINFGDGSSATGRLMFKVTSIDAERNWLVGVGHLRTEPDATTIRHAYPRPGDFVAYVETCCRISECLPPNRHINNPDGRYRLQTRVDVGTGNRPPSSTLVPILGFRRNALTSFGIPAADPDGDEIRFRLSTPAEASGSTFRQPGFAGSGAPIPCSVTPDGVFSWDTTGATLSADARCPGTLYSTQVIMEDLALDGTSKSQVALDFFIQLNGRGEPPVFEPPTPCEETIFVATRQPFEFTVRASDVDGDDVRLNALGLPAGATLTPALPQRGNPVEVVFRWNPAVSQVGTHVISFVANDDFAQSQCQVIVNVSACTNVVTFDTDAAGRAIAEGTDVSDGMLLDLGVKLDGRSRDNDSPGVFAIRQGPPGSETDDIVPVSGPNFVTTLADPDDMSSSDYGSICVDFIDPVTRRPRTVEYAEIWFLDVEDSVATIRAFDGPFCTGEVLFRTRIEDQGDRSQSRSSVGAIFSGARIASMRVEFGDTSDSAGLDSLCFEPTPSTLSIDDGREPGEVIAVSPGGSVNLDVTVTNASPSRFPAVYELFLVRRPDDPDRKALRSLRKQNVSVPPGAPLSHSMAVTVPPAFGARHVGERFALCHSLASREGFVEDVLVQTIEIVP